jgi:hypothetical protein
LEVGIAVLGNLKKIAFVLGYYIKINVGAGLVTAQNHIASNIKNMQMLQSDDPEK